MSQTELLYVDSGTNKPVKVNDTNPLPVSESVNNGLQVGGFDPVSPPSGTDYPFTSSTLTKCKKIFFNHIAGGSLRIRYGDTGPVLFTLLAAGSFVLEYSVPGNLYADATDVGGGADADVIYIGEA